MVPSVHCVIPTIQQQHTFWVAVQSLYHSNGTPIDITKFYIIIILASKLTTLFADCHDVKVHADLQGFRSNDSPPETILLSVLVTPYRSDIVIYNAHSSLMGIVELTFPLDSVQHIESARDRKQFKPEYQQLLAELDCLTISTCYRTVEVSVLGHFQPKSIHAIKDVTCFIQQVFSLSKTIVLENF